MWLSTVLGHNHHTEQATTAERALVSGEREDGGSCAPAEINDQQVQMSIGRVTLCSGKEKPWQNWGENVKNLPSKQSCLH